MKKILVFLLVLLSAHANAQIEETVEFDFTKPSSLNPSLNVSKAVGDLMIVDYMTFTSGPVEMSFTNSGQGAAINNASSESPFYTLAICARTGMKLGFSKSGYAFSYVQFEGALGDLRNVNTVTKKWTAYDKSTTEVTFTNGINETRISKIKVCYSRAAMPVSQPLTTPKSGDKVSSFKTMRLQFDMPMTVVHEKGIKLYTLDQDGERIGSQDMIATVSATDSRTILLTAEKEIMQDGSFEVYVPAGSFQNSEQSSSPEIKVPFTVYADRATLRYESVTPDPTEGNVPKVPATITLKYADNQSVSIVEDGEHEVVVYQDDVYNFTPVALDVDDHNVVLTLDGEMTAEGDWYVVIPEGTITNGFSPESPYYRCNPKTTLVYTVENELSLYRAEATALLAAGGKDAALIGYPADGTASRQALIDALANSEATSEELQKAIDDYYAETNVKLPEDSKWYKLVAVNDKGEKRFLKYGSNGLVPSSTASEASAFKALVKADGQTFSFMTSDGKFLAIKSIGEEQSGALPTNLILGNLTDFSLAKLSVEGQKLAGFLTLKGDEYAVVAFGEEMLLTTSGSTVQYGEGLTSAFSFVETVEETKPDPDPEIITSPYAKLEERASKRAGDMMILTFLSVQNVSLLDVDAPYFTQNGNKVAFEGQILTGVPRSYNQFYVNTRGLKTGVYNLVLPAGSFNLLTISGERAASEEIVLSFVIDNTTSDSDNPEGFIEDFQFIPYQFITRSEMYIKDMDLKELYLFVHGDGVLAGLAVDTTKRVGIVAAYTDGEIAHGHFVPYPEFAEEVGFEIGTVQAVKLVVDSVFEEGTLDGAPGLYGYRIPTGALGDLNYGRYLAGDPDVKPSDCHVNKVNYSITFYVNNLEASKVYPSSEVIDLGNNLQELYGLGYPTSESEARVQLKQRWTHIEGSDEVYRGYINDFYNETNVMKPSEGVYYKVYAVAADGTKAYLDYDGNTVGVTSDSSKATGFKMVVNEDGTYRFVTGYGSYLCQLSEASNTTDTYNATANNIAVEKLSIKGVDPAKTFGLFSLKMANAYAVVDVKNTKIKTATATLADSDAERTNAFMFEEVKSTDIPAPLVTVVLSPVTGSKVDAREMNPMMVTFSGAKLVDLKDASQIVLTDINGQEIKPSKIERSVNNSNRYEFSFLGIEEGQSYFFTIGQGAFTYTFAERTCEVGAVKAAYTIITTGTGITGITVDPSDDAVYDLQGRMVTGTLKSGVYIKNGKKVYIK